MTELSKIVIDGTSFNVSELPQAARDTINSIQFVDALLQQKQNEWAIADTSRLAYLAALKREVLK